MHVCCPPVTLEQDLHRKMHSWMLQTLAFAVTSLVLSCAETIDYYGEICDNACPCEEKDGILTVSCENRGIISLSEISPPRFPIYHLLLSGNLLSRLYPNEFVNYTGASILHLGSNVIQDIETGAFHGLRGLRRLHLNNNKLELLRDDTFLGLENLEYLQVDYNYISVIEPNAFGKLHMLQVLILNDNLLSGLPNNLFRFVPLTHLDLRGNRLKLLPKPYNPKKMYLTENYITVVRRTDFLEATGLDLLHLGNNRISMIQDRAFGDLGNLRRLYLNGNRIERLSPELFYGLQSLQYLFLQYNLIREIQAGTFDPVPNLQLLFLNNNQLQAMPSGVFSGLTLLRLNLRGNSFTSLPVSGVLDQLTSLIQIDLHDNPWDCTCDVVGMKLWIEQLKVGVLVDEVICKAPKKFAETYMRSIKSELLCPDYSDVVVSTPTPSSIQVPSRTNAATPAVRLNSTGTPAGLGAGTGASSVPLSVLILSLLLVFIMSVFVAAGLFVLVMKRRKKNQSDHTSTNNSDVSSFNMQYSVYGGGGGGGGGHPHAHVHHRGPALPKVKTPAGHVYEYIPHPLGHMCKNPIYRSREGNSVEDYKDLHELKVTYSSNHHLQQQPPPPPQQPQQQPPPQMQMQPGEEERRESHHLRSPAYSVSTIEPREDLLSPVQDADRFYRGILEPDKHCSTTPAGSSLPEYPKFPCSPAAYTFSPNYDLRRPHQYLHPGAGESRLREPVLYSPPGAVFVEPNRNEYLELKAKLNVEPDYLEVLEKQTTFSQF